MAKALAFEIEGFWVLKAQKKLSAISFLKYKLMKSNAIILVRFFDFFWVRNLEF